MYMCKRIIINILFFCVCVIDRRGQVSHYSAHAEQSGGVGETAERDQRKEDKKWYVQSCNVKGVYYMTPRLAYTTVTET